MVEIEKINLGMDSTGKGGDSQRTAFEKCNDNIEILANSIKAIQDRLDSGAVSGGSETVSEDNDGNGSGSEDNDNWLDIGAISDKLRTMEKELKGVEEKIDSGEVVPLLSQTNTFSAPQVVKTYGGGLSNIRLENSADWGADKPIVKGTVYRGPVLTSICPTWGTDQKGVYAEFLVEEKAGTSTQAVIGLKDWDQKTRYWVFRDDGNAYSPGSWASSSDKRLKTDLKVIGSEVDILEQCQTFRGYTYKRKTNNRYEAGFMAQDIKKVLPESVFTNQDITLDDGTVVKDALSLDYGAMNAYHHECILAVLDKLKEYEQRIKVLEQKQGMNAEV